MGTHAKAPSTVSHPPSLSGLLLSDWLKSNRWALGDEVAEKFDGKLPFLFKVLSIGKSLSIQAHPTQSHARELHAHHPDKYPDPNHKPEMVIALRDFEGFCGFRPLGKIQTFVSSVPEVRSLIDEEVVGRFLALDERSAPDVQRSGLREVFSAVTHSDPTDVASRVNQLAERVKEAGEASTHCHACAAGQCHACSSVTTLYSNYCTSVVATVCVLLSAHVPGVTGYSSCCVHTCT